MCVAGNQRSWNNLSQYEIKLFVFIDNLTGLLKCTILARTTRIEVVKYMYKMDHNPMTLCVIDSIQLDYKCVHDFDSDSHDEPYDSDVLTLIFTLFANDYMVIMV